MHVYLQHYRQEKLLWSEALDHYRQLGVFNKMSQAHGGIFKPEIFEYLGMQLAADMATHMTSLRDQYPLEQLGSYSSLTYADWDLIERVIMTR
jgi:hypothetical protein